MEYLDGTELPAQGRPLICFSAGYVINFTELYSKSLICNQLIEGIAIYGLMPQWHSSV